MLKMHGVDSLADQELPRTKTQRIKILDSCLGLSETKLFAGLALGNLTKNQQKRKIMKIAIKQPKQSTLDNLIFQFNIQKSTALNQARKGNCD